MITRRIVVAILTYRRPDDLHEVVPAVAKALEPLATRGEGVEVLVIDNDPDGGAEDAVRRLAAEAAPGRVRYLHEPIPGIAAARNAALDWSIDRDLLIFIDDDERPHAGWAEHLVDCHDAYDQASVAGAVVSPLPPDIDPYISQGRFFERLRHPTGTVVTAAATNNLLLDLATIRRRGLRFDARFGITGGSDHLFTRALTEGGDRIVWCDEAVVDDKVPVGRLTRRWVLRKAYRIGNTTSRVDSVLAASLSARVQARTRNLARGVARVGAGGVQAAFGAAARNPSARARGDRLVARGLGLATGALGLVYAEYARSSR